MKSAADEFLRKLLERAYLENTSDIHLEPFENSFAIRLRTPMGLKSYPAPSKDVYGALGRHLKLLSKMDIAVENLPQDGKFSFDPGCGELEFRLATLPTLFGESFVLRVLDRTRTPLEIDALGFSQDISLALKRALDHPFGLIVVGGATGSGKTTTVYACLRQLLHKDLKILSIEDPIEYAIEGIQQASVSPQMGFPEALRAFLRHDPDVIFVGEIRDSLTARLAMQAALTGHLVLSTLHTHSPEQCLYRLHDLGIGPKLMESSLRFVLTQKLSTTSQNTRGVTGEFWEAKDLEKPLKRLAKAKL